MIKSRTYATLLLAVVMLTSANGAGLPDRRQSHVIPSISMNNVEHRVEKMVWKYLCYSFRTGAPRGCTILHHTLFGVEESANKGIVALDCVIEADGSVQSGTCADGGHQHAVATATPRPLTRINDPANQLLANQMPLLFGVLDTSPDKFVVAGQMPANQWIRVEYEVPDNAGFFYWQAHVQPPPCYFLPQYCGFVGPGAQDDGTAIWDGTVEVSYRDLRQLPDMRNLYRKVRNGPGGVGTDQGHTDEVAFAGDEMALEAMRLIAKEYNTATGELLRPNDMSLPLGGLFDVAATYQFSHQTHRFGRDIDVNRQPVVFLPGGGEAFPDRNCEEDRDFVEAVNKVLLPVRNVTVTPPGGTSTTYATAVLCETGGRKHIDVTQVVLTQRTP